MKLGIILNIINPQILTNIGKEAISLIYYFKNYYNSISIL